MERSELDTGLVRNCKWLAAVTRRAVYLLPEELRRQTKVPDSSRIPAAAATALKGLGVPRDKPDDFHSATEYGLSSTPWDPSRPCLGFRVFDAEDSVRMLSAPTSRLRKGKNGVAFAYYLVSMLEAARSNFPGECVSSSLDSFFTDVAAKLRWLEVKPPSLSEGIDRAVAANNVRRVFYGVSCEETKADCAVAGRGDTACGAHQNISPLLIP